MHFIAPIVLLAICLVQLLPALPSMQSVYLAGFSCLGMLCIIYWYVSASRIRYFLTHLAVFVLAACWVMCVAHMLLAWQLPQALENQKILIKGQIISLPERTIQRTKFDFRVDEIIHQNIRMPAKVKLRLYWYRDAPLLRSGEYWQLQVKLKRPRSYANPGGQDYTKLLFSQHIRATGYVRVSKANQCLQPAKPFSVAALRSHINEFIDEQLSDNAYRGLVKALTIGVRDGLRQEDWQVLQHTGTSHLMAISGLHVGMVSAVIFFLLFKFWSWRRSWLLRWPASRVAAVGALLFAVFYSLLAGFSLPTQRALIMLSCVMLGKLSLRNITMSFALSLALLLILLSHPLAVLETGFWLSFFAVASIGFLVGGRLQAKGKLWQWLRLQLGISVLLMPISIHFFQLNALQAPLANFIAIPVIGLVILPLCLITALCIFIYPPLAKILLLAITHLFAVLWSYLQWLADLPGWLWQPAELSSVFLLLMCVGCLVCLLPRGFPGRVSGVVTLLTLLWVRAPQPAKNEIWVTVLDVGQGLATVVRTHQHTLIYDTGPRFGTGFDSGRMIITPFLRRQGVKSIDAVIISHLHNDHVGGLAYLQQHVPIKQLITHDVQGLASQAVACYAGDSWQWDEVQFTFLHPARGDSLSINDASCVLKINFGEISLLLPGDIESQAESLLVQRYDKQLSANIMLAPHHGSRTSSTSEFVAQVAPQIVVFPLGYLNRFGFPHRQVVRTYQAAQAELYDTATHGAITFKWRIDSSQITTQWHRQEQIRYWH
jgi:competence protein ComEC